MVECKEYRERVLVTCKEDHPLIVQFAANDAKILLQAALYAQEVCDAIDINLGCPQQYAFIDELEYWMRSDHLNSRIGQSSQGRALWIVFDG